MTWESRAASNPHTKGYHGEAERRTRERGLQPAEAGMQFTPMERTKLSRKCRHAEN